MKTICAECPWRLDPKLKVGHWAESYVGVESHKCHMRASTVCEGRAQMGLTEGLVSTWEEFVKEHENDI